VTTGRRRVFDDTIPKHIDQAKIPRGVYWDKRDRVWYTLFRDGPRQRRRKLAGPKALLSDLHRIIEQLHGVDRKSLDAMMQAFRASAQFAELADGTKKRYDRCQVVASTHKTTVGLLGGLPAEAITAPVVQKIVDRIADEGYPSKANHLLRYLRRVYTWGKNRGFVTHNPCSRVEQATERKRRRMPTDLVFTRLAEFARERGQITAHRKGALAEYLWIAVELMYLCRLRGIEVITLSEAAELPPGLRTNRVKGSRDNIVAWSPRLRVAWDAALARRRAILERRGAPTHLKPEDRIAMVSQDGSPLRKSSFDSAWQRMMLLAIAEGVIGPEDRFGAHDVKHKGVTDTAGNRHDKQTASGHKSERMLDVYDHEVPVVNPAGKR
jgi:site-specific recombinase XerD